MRFSDPRFPSFAFQPPSDMVGGGGSSRGKKLFVGLGIGCGILLVIFGILTAAGAFKMVTCCNDIKGIAEDSVAAQEFGLAFADDIHAGALDAAYARTAAEFQSSKPLDQFKAAVQVHHDRMQSNKPRLINMQLEQHSQGQNPSIEELKSGTWLLSYQFAAPADTTMLLLNIRVGQAAEGSDAKFEVRDVFFDERPRNLQMEPPAEEVLQLHDMIQRGQYEMAHARLGDEFRTGTDRETWRGFLRDAGEIVTSSQLEIREVTYDETNTHATVMAHARTSTGKNAIIQYELQPARAEVPGFGWKVVAIAPLVAESNEAAPNDPVAATNNATNNAEGAPPAGTTAGVGD